ncbi:MAG: transcription antitermination factor NusB [Clostridia bacterium]|nr:transcription antitermination factor NusB [Clostridia bacterium]
MTRKQEREKAFCLIFEKSFKDDSCEEILELAESINEFELTEHTKMLFTGVFENIEFIDGVISKYLKNWTINRISKTDLSLMRLAVYEMKFCDDIPENVTINEIVELAKSYCGEKGPSYINGVLGSISRSGDLA